MRLLYIVYTQIPTQKAHGYQVAKMCEEFARAGLDVELLAARSKKSDETFSFYGLQTNFKISTLPSWKMDGLGKFGLFLQLVSFIIFALPKIYLSKADVIYVRGIYFCYLASLVRKNIFLEIHALSGSEFFLKHGLARAKGVIAITEKIKSICQEKYSVPAKKILVSSDGVDPAVFDISISKEEARKKLDLPEDKKILLYTGKFTTMGMDKGISGILKALKILGQNDWLFLAVGGSISDIELYKKKAEEFGIEQQVRFLGHRTQKELAVYQKAADVLLMPFPENQHYALYMSPLKMFEYMVSGRPIIASDLPSIREVLNDSNAFFVRPDDPKSLGEGIGKVFSDERLAESLAQKAYQDVPSFTWDRRAQNIISFIKTKEKLIYCTSIAFSDKVANRVQIHSMAKQFQKKLGKNFCLGVNYKNQDDPELDIISFNSNKSYILSWRYLKYISKEGFNIVYCREARLLFFIILFNILFFRLKLRTVYEMHSLLSRDIFDYFIDRFLARRAGYKILLTENLKKLYLEKYPAESQSVLVSPDAVDPEIFDIPISKEEARKELGFEPDKKLLVYTGRFKTMEMDKGIGDILKALKGLNRKDLFFLAIGGSEKDIEFYKKEAERIGVQKSVLFLGSKPQKQLAIYQKAADILLMPFPKNEHYSFYMSPLKMFEYMAAARPIIATDLPSVREVLDNSNSVLAKPGNPDDLALKIKQVLSDNEMAQKIGQKARSDSFQYTWGKRVNNILEFIGF